MLDKVRLMSKTWGGGDPRREIGFGFDDVGLAFLVIFIFYLNGCDGFMVHVGPPFVGESKAGPAKCEDDTLGDTLACSLVNRDIFYFLFLLKEEVEFFALLLVV